MPRGGKRKGAGRPKFNDDNPTTHWVIYNVLLEIDRDALGRYQRKMAKESTFAKVKKVGTPIEAAALVAIRETVELKEEEGRLISEIARLNTLHPEAASIVQLSDDLQQTRYVAVPDEWTVKSKVGGMRVFIEGGIQPTQ